MIGERLVDIYAYVDQQLTKLSKLTKDVQTVKDQIVTVEDQYKKTVKKRVGPVIVPEGFKRKSVHELTDSAEQKIMPRIIPMDKLNRVEGS